MTTYLPRLSRCGQGRVSVVCFGRMAWEGVIVITDNDRVMILRLRTPHRPFHISLPGNHFFPTSRGLASDPYTDRLVNEPLLEFLFFALHMDSASLTSLARLRVYTSHAFSSSCICRDGAGRRKSVSTQGAVLR